MTSTIPTIFFGHGNPMNALYNNSWTEELGMDRGHDTAAKSDLVHIGALVYSRRCGDRNGAAADNTRHWRLSA